MTLKTNKIIRSHDRQKKTSKRDPKGERYHLQGVRWRFSKDLGLGEIEVRISRLKALWADQEKFCQSGVFLDLGAAAYSDDLCLDDAVALVQASGKTAGLEDFCQDAEYRQGPEKIDQRNSGAGPGQSWLQWSVKRKGIVSIPLEATWSPLSRWIADQMKLGVQPVRLPPWVELIESVCRQGKIEYRFRGLAEILSRPAEAQPTRTEQLDSKDAMSLLRSLMQVFPSVPWAMHDHQIENVVRLHDERARNDLDLIREIKPDDPSVGHLSLAMAGVRGTLHGAFRSYLKKRTADFTTHGAFDGSGHHMLGLVENFLKRLPDEPLSRLGFAESQQLYDFWRNRPLNTRTQEPLSAKHCTSHMGELDRFFKWLHKASEFKWKRPDDFELIDRKVKRIDSDRRSINNIELQTFQIEHLKLLYQHASTVERLKLLWCLNCSHGAAEIGRVEWRDVYLEQQHPWIKEGLKCEVGSDDSWCGFLRPKTDVVGWWWLWPETVQLVQWWRGELRRRLSRELLPSERMLLTNTGEPMYRDSSRNAQTSFANQWTRLLDRVIKNEDKDAVPRLPFGTLRDQLSNWLGSDENLAVLASTALAHGVPHKGDRLLFKHYSNRPWAHLFKKQREYRQVLQPMFDLVPNPLSGTIPPRK